MAIQALQPRVKEIQEKYKGRDPQEAQVGFKGFITLSSEELSDCRPPV